MQRNAPHQHPEPAQLRRERGLDGLSLLSLAAPATGVFAVHEGVVRAYAKTAYDDFHTLTLHLDGAPLSRRRRAPDDAERSLPGAVSLQPCDAEGVWDSEASCRWLHFYLPVALVDRLAETHYGVARDQLRLATVTGRHDACIVPLLHRAAAGLSAGAAPDEMELARCAEDIALRWLAAYSNLATAPRGRERLAPHKLKRACEWMESRLAEPLRIPDLARELGMSPAHFARAFHHAAGEPPHRHLLHLRAARARALLAERDRPLAEIALETGFANQAHLTTTFARVYGIAPGLCRRRLVGPAWPGARH